MEMKIDDQVSYLMQGTEYGDEELKKRMAAELRDRLIVAQQEKRPLCVYCGFDPRTSDLHIGHFVPIQKLRQFQELGHQVTFLVGTYTSLIGDPSDKDKLRPILSQEEAVENARTYAEQACKILDPDKIKIRYNHEWLSKLSFSEVVKLTSNFTVQQFLARENFRKRWDKAEAIYLHETLYAVMQGYDAYTLNADIQVGGLDQLFNIVTASRKLMSVLGAKPNIAVIMGILPGTDGDIKMSKSLGNHIPILAAPKDMYGRVMSIPDKAIHTYYVMVTKLKPREIDEIMSGMESGRLHPRDVKMKLAREIVTIFHSTSDAQHAEEEFIQVFRRNQIPEELPEYFIQSGQTLLDVLKNSDLVHSRSEGRRLIQQRAVRFNGKPLTDPHTVLKQEGVLQVGKRKFLRLR